MKLIACTDLGNGIGFENQLLFRIPADMQFFRKTTTGHPVIMGRKTWESLQVRPLPSRLNIILSSSMKDSDIPISGVRVVNSIESLLKLPNIADAFVIGGGEVYRSLLPYCDSAYITLVDTHVQADTFMPDIRLHPDWEYKRLVNTGEYDGAVFAISEYVRKDGT